MLSLIISTVFLSFSVVFLLLALGWRRRLSQLESQLAFFKQEPREAPNSTEEKEDLPKQEKTCVLCKHAGTTWSVSKVWKCCETEAIVCGICSREAGDGLEERLRSRHEELLCPQAIALAGVLRIVKKEKEDAEAMLAHPDVVHNANLAVAESMRTEEKWKFGVPDRNVCVLGPLERRLQRKHLGNRDEREKA